MITKPQMTPIDADVVDKTSHLRKSATSAVQGDPDLKRALLVSFGAARLEYRRIVLGYEG